MNPAKRVNPTNNPIWHDPPAGLDLADDELHVWRASLELPVEQIRHLLPTLSPEERERGARFHLSRDRDRFIIARAALRDILARYLGLHPGELRFSYNPFGKPALVEQLAGRTLAFNLAHSHQLALYALTLDREIGIDLEHVRGGLDHERIARQFFSPREFAALRALPKDLRPLAFFTCWTRKEALVKAHGEGLSLPLDQFEVSLAPDEPPALHRVGQDPQAGSQWLLCGLNPGADYVSAFAVRADVRRFAFWQWLPANV